MNILDGVIFAALSDEDWEDHVTERTQRPVQRRKRASGKGYHYRERPPEPATALPSDAERMIADPRLDLADSLSRNILADALLDEGRERESNLLRGVIGETAVIHAGRVMEPHELPDDQIEAAVYMALLKVDKNPSATMTIHWSERMDEPKGTITVNFSWPTAPTRAAVKVPAAVLIAAARRHPLPGELSAASMEHYTTRFRADADREMGIINDTPVIGHATLSSDLIPADLYVWAHARQSRREEVIPRGPSDISYEIRSFVNSLWNSNERSYYVVMNHPVWHRPMLNANPTTHRPFHTPQATRNHLGVPEGAALS